MRSTYRGLLMSESLKSRIGVMPSTMAVLTTGGETVRRLSVQYFRTRKEVSSAVARTAWKITS